MAYAHSQVGGGLQSAEPRATHELQGRQQAAAHLAQLGRQCLGAHSKQLEGQLDVGRLHGGGRQAGLLTLHGEMASAGCTDCNSSRYVSRRAPPIQPNGSSQHHPSIKRNLNAARPLNQLPIHPPTKPHLHLLRLEHRQHAPRLLAHDG